MPNFVQFLIKKFLIFATLKKGPLAEWLGKALQKLLQRFESARDLKRDYLSDSPFRFLR